MIVHGIKTHNFMSLQDCTIDQLDSRLNFLVGPNGCGKTTVFRALKAIHNTFNFEKPIRVPFNQLCTRGISPQEIDLTLDIEFNTSWEKDLITTFICASLSRPYELPGILSPKLPQPIAQLNTGGFEAFSDWLLHTFSSKTLSFLFRGKLHLSYRSHSYENLRLGYTFSHEGVPFTITIRPLDGVLVSGNIPTFIPGGYSPVNTLVDFFERTNNLQDVVNLLTRPSFPAVNSFDPVACLLYLGEKRVTLGIDNTNSQQAFLSMPSRILCNVRTSQRGGFKAILQA